MSRAASWPRASPASHCGRFREQHPLALEYGRDRFGFGESVHATINRRFGLLQDKSPMRDIVEVETEFAVAFSVVSVLLLEREARRQADENVTPLPISSAPEALPLAA
jgi:hypothetical protein